jgi:hypothetical protein
LRPNGEAGEERRIIIAAPLIGNRSVNQARACTHKSQ